MTHNDKDERRAKFLARRKGVMDDCPICGGFHPSEGKDCRAYYPPRDALDRELDRIEARARAQREAYRTMEIA